MPPALDRLYSERDRALTSVDEIVERADTDDRDLSDAERELIGRTHARIAELDPQIELAEAQETARALHASRAPAPAPRTAHPEPIAPDTVYRTFGEYARDVLVTRYDAIAQRAGGGNARQAAEQRLDVARAVANTTTTTVAGLVPPQYLTQLLEVISTSRPIVESARRIGLTSGQLMYPSITQKPIVGKQTAEKTEAPSQALQVAFVTVTADTYVGAGDISWQAINWSTPDALTLWFDLAAEQYAIQTEAATGTALAAVAGTVTVATDDLTGWMAAIATAAGEVFSKTRRRADTVYLDVVTGYHLIGLVSDQSPVFLPGGGFSLSSGAGTVAGLQLVISAGLPASTCVVGVSSSLLCAETAGAPVELRAVEPALGGMEVGVIGAFVAKVTDGQAFVKLTPPAGP